MQNFIIILYMFYLPFQLRLPQAPVINTVNIFLVLFLIILLLNFRSVSAASGFDAPLAAFLVIWTLSFVHTMADPGGLVPSEIATEFKRLITLPLGYYLVRKTAGSEKNINMLFFFFCLSIIATGVFTWEKGMLAGTHFSDQKRSSGPFAPFDTWGASDIAGGFLATFTPFILAYLVSGRGGLLKKMVFAAGLAACTMGLMATYSRGSLIAFAAGCIAVLLFRTGNLPKALFTAIVVAVIFFSGALNLFLPETVMVRMQNTISTDSLSEEISLDESSRLRIDKWNNGLNKFAENWFAGMGFDKSRIEGAGRRVDLHNTFIVIAAEMGIAGIAVFLLFIWKTAAEAYSLTATRFGFMGTGFIGCLVSFMIVNMFYANFFRDTVVGSFWIALGLLAASKKILTAENG